MTDNMTEDEAQKEVDEINADIARSKGIDPETGEKLGAPKDPAEPKEEEEETEPDADPKKPKREAPEKESDAEDEEDEDLDEDEDEDDSPKKRTADRIPLKKFQQYKAKSREEIAGMKNQIDDLTSKLSEATTKKEIGGEIKAFAEKFDMPEEAVSELILLAAKATKGTATLDPDTLKAVKEAQVIGKKQEAEKAFEAEFSDLIKDNPDAEEARAQIRKEAYKDGNLDKSLFEIYHRFVKPEVVPKKKTGEASRGANRDGVKTIDFAKIAEDVRNNVPGALANLSGEQQDKLFEWMETNGSRYSGTRS